MSENMVATYVVAFLLDTDVANEDGPVRVPAHYAVQGQSKAVRVESSDRWGGSYERTYR